MSPPHGSSYSWQEDQDLEIIVEKVLLRKLADIGLEPEYNCSGLREHDWQDLVKEMVARRLTDMVWNKDFILVAPCPHGVPTPPLKGTCPRVI